VCTQHSARVIGVLISHHTAFAKVQQRHKLMKVLRREIISFSSHFAANTCKHVSNKALTTLLHTKAYEPVRTTFVQSRSYVRLKGMKTKPAVRF
jgi:hypothetical protein